MKVAVSGKGGVGKTLIAGALASCLSRKGLKTLGIDADPSPNLGLTLGLSIKQAEEIVPISDNKALIESKTGTGYSGVFRLSFGVDDIVREYSVGTPFGVNLIVMGTVKSMGSGCTCGANAVVRALLRHLVVERSEAVVLDMEAGVEHIGRATARNVDVMLVVSDANMKSLEIAKQIYKLSMDAGMKSVFLVGNKIEGRGQERIVNKFARENDLDMLGTVPFDHEIVEAEVRGETALSQQDSKALIAVERICEKLTMNDI